MCVHKIMMWWWHFPHLRGFWENVWQFVPPRLFFFLLFLKCRLACTHTFHSLSHGQSMMAQRAEMIVTECSLTACVWAHFLTGSHTMPEQWHSQPTLTLLGQRCTCLSATCHLHVWQNDRGLLCATAVTQGCNGHRRRVSTQSWLEKKIPPPHIKN